MPAFSGKYYYSIDPKGRLIIPAPFREIISTHYNPKLYVEALFNKCLHNYPQEEWTKLEQKVRQLPSMDEAVQYFKRKVIASAQEIELDKQGRIHLPNSMRAEFGLNKDVVLNGMLEHFEIWDKTSWVDETRRTRDKFKDYEQGLASLGIL